jgi:hypothetical protein
VRTSRPLRPSCPDLAGSPRHHTLTSPLGEAPRAVQSRPAILVVDPDGSTRVR